MTSTTKCLASLAGQSATSALKPMSTSSPKFLAPSASRSYATMVKKREKIRKAKDFKVWDKRPLQRYSLCDSMRYLRACEVGRPPNSVKYEVALKVKTLKNGPTVRGKIRLPHIVQTDVRVAVACKDGSPAEAEAIEAGAVLVGETAVMSAVRNDKINFNRLVCHQDSLITIQKAQGIARILGPKGLMPSAKTGTVTTDIKGTLREMVGAVGYQEREGVIRIPIGYLSSTPDMLSANIKAFMGVVKPMLADNKASQPKHIDEVVLSTTNGPGFSLNGETKSLDENVEPEHLAGAV